MKKLQLSFFISLLCATISFSQNLRINGAGSSCFVLQPYYISGMNDCSGNTITSVTVSGGGIVSFITTDSFYVQWTSAGYHTINVTYDVVNYEYVDTPRGPRRICSTYPNTTNVGKTVHVFNSTVGYPNAVSQGVTTRFPRKYTFSTTATDAATYEWDISNGTIVGCTTCSTIKVQATPGTCTISGTVRAKNVCGVISAPRGFSRSISPPSQPTPINGPTYVGAYGDFKLYTVNNDTNTTRYNWYFALGAQFLGNSSSNQVSVVCNTNNETATTLYVTATNSCGQSFARAKVITGGQNPPFGGLGSFREVNTITIVQPVQKPEQMTILIPDYINTDKVTIFDIAGQPMATFKPKEVDTSLDTSTFKKGIYFLISENATKSIRKKFIIK